MIFLSTYRNIFCIGADLVAFDRRERREDLLEHLLGEGRLARQVLVLLRWSSLFTLHLIGALQFTKIF